MDYLQDLASKLWGFGPTKIPVIQINPHLICALCNGYYVDATTITECLHSFCKSCIVPYLETSKYCPICEVMVHKTRPLQHIKADHTLQDLVYKLVPGLFSREMQARKDYYTQQEEEKKATEDAEEDEIKDENNEEDDKVEVKSAKASPKKSSPKKSPAKSKVKPDEVAEVKDETVNDDNPELEEKEKPEDEKISISLQFSPDGKPHNRRKENGKYPAKRYLLCPAAFSVRLMKKFIRMKFGLDPQYEVDVFHTSEMLDDQYTLMDIAYIYSWQRTVPLKLYYSVFVDRGKAGSKKVAAIQFPMKQVNPQFSPTSRLNISDEASPPKLQKIVPLENDKREDFDKLSAKKKSPSGKNPISNLPPPTLPKITLRTGLGKNPKPLSVSTGSNETVPVQQPATPGSEADKTAMSPPASVPAKAKSKKKKKKSPGDAPHVPRNQVLVRDFAGRFISPKNIDDAASITTITVSPDKITKVHTPTTRCLTSPVPSGPGLKTNVVKTPVTVVTTRDINQKDKAPPSKQKPKGGAEQKVNVVSPKATSVIPAKPGMKPVVTILSKSTTSNRIVYNLAKSPGGGGVAITKTLPKSVANAVTIAGVMQTPATLQNPSMAGESLLAPVVVLPKASVEDMVSQSAKLTSVSVSTTLSSSPSTPKTGKTTATSIQLTPDDAGLKTATNVSSQMTTSTRVSTAGVGVTTTTVSKPVTLASIVKPPGSVSLLVSGAVTPSSATIPLSSVGQTVQKGVSLLTKGGTSLLKPSVVNPSSTVAVVSAAQLAAQANALSAKSGKSKVATTGKSSTPVAKTGSKSDGSAVKASKTGTNSKSSSKGKTNTPPVQTGTSTTKSASVSVKSTPMVVKSTSSSVKTTPVSSTSKSKNVEQGKPKSPKSDSKKAIDLPDKKAKSKDNSKSAAVTKTQSSLANTPVSKPQSTPLVPQIKSSSDSSTTDAMPVDMTVSKPKDALDKSGSSARTLPFLTVTTSSVTSTASKNKMTTPVITSSVKDTSATNSESKDSQVKKESVSVKDKSDELSKTSNGSKVTVVTKASSIVTNNNNNGSTSPISLLKSNPKLPGNGKPFGKKQNPGATLAATIDKIHSSLQPNLKNSPTNNKSFPFASNGPSEKPGLPFFKSDSKGKQNGPTKVDSKQEVKKEPVTSASSASSVPPIVTSSSVVVPKPEPMSPNTTQSPSPASIIENEAPKSAPAKHSLPVVNLQRMPSFPSGTGPVLGTISVVKPKKPAVTLSSRPSTSIKRPSESQDGGTPPKVAKVSGKANEAKEVKKNGLEDSKSKAANSSDHSISRIIKDGSKDSSKTDDCVVKIDKPAASSEASSATTISTATTKGLEDVVTILPPKDKEKEGFKVSAGEEPVVIYITNEADGAGKAGKKVEVASNGKDDSSAGQQSRKRKANGECDSVGEEEAKSKEPKRAEKEMVVDGKDAVKVTAAKTTSPKVNGDVGKS